MVGLILNGGSTSIKIALFNKKEKIACGHYLFEDPKSIFYFHQGSKVETLPIKQKGPKALDALFLFIKSRFSSLDYLGHRLVHGGSITKNPFLITPLLLKKLKSLSPLAPMHQPLECLAIEKAQKLWPNSPSYGACDTAFFHSLADDKKLYPLSSFFEKKGIRRYGFHGINHEYCVQKIHQSFPTQKNLKIIVCHLGGGCSLSASLGQSCIDTTMGFTPLDGIMMGSRPGSLDPGISIYLLKNKHLSLKELEQHYLYQSGLKGISNLSSDYSLLLKKQKNHSRVKLALEMFHQHLVKGILGMMASLKGCDVLVFTAGIGEHCTSLRSEVIKRLNFLGFKIDQKKNRAKDPFWISSSTSSTKIAVLPAEEEKFIAEKIKL